MEVAEELAEEDVEAMRKATRQRVRWADVEEFAGETGAMAQGENEEDRKECVMEQEELERRKRWNRVRRRGKVRGAWETESEGRKDLSRV